MNYKSFQILFAVIIFLVGSLLFTNLSHSVHATPQYLAQNKMDTYVVRALSLYFTPTTSPSSIIDATVTPTPTPTIDPGYCLNVPILLYHHTEPLSLASQSGHAQLTVGDDYFDQQMRYLRDSGYKTVTIEQLSQALLNKQTLPPKSIAVTIDDGYSDNYTYGYAILKKYGLVGNFMIPAGLIENPGYMTWDQVRDLSSNGQAIYNHTWSHAALGNISKEAMMQEVSSANKKLEEVTGKKITVFTYPYGSFSPLAISTLKELGFTLALTTQPGSWQCDKNIMSLYRNHVGNAPLSSYGY